jgi:hypothetical protein
MTALGLGTLSHLMLKYTKQNLGKAKTQSKNNNYNSIIYFRGMIEFLMEIKEDVHVQVRF